MALTIVANLPLNTMKNWKRGGIIGYSINKDEVELVVAKDRLSGDISNFAGSMTPSDKNIINTSIREFNEETLGVFGKIDRKVLKKCLVIYNDIEVIIFYPLSYKKDIVSKKFISRCNKKSYTEMENLIFCNITDFFSHLAESSGKEPIYQRVRDLMVNAIYEYGNFLD